MNSKTENLFIMFMCVCLQFFGLVLRGQRGVLERDSIIDFDQKSLEFMNEAIEVLKTK